jgi:hypothetical protein
MRVTVVSTLQVLACIVIAVAGLVPVFHKNRPFWGLYGSSINHGAPRVHQVDNDSPAQSAGLQVDDVIVTANGSAVDQSGLTALLEGLKPGEVARLHVKRGESEVDMSVRGVEPPVAMIYYPTPFPPVAGGIGVALGLLVLATQTLRPAPRWRAALVGITGFALAVLFFLAVTDDSVLPFWQLRRYHTLNWGAKWHFEQAWVGLVASLALAVLGAWELRGLLRGSALAGGSPPNMSPPQTRPA